MKKDGKCSNNMVITVTLNNLCALINKNCLTRYVLIENKYIFKLCFMILLYDHVS